MKKTIIRLIDLIKSHKLIAAIAAAVVVVIVLIIIILNKKDETGFLYNDDTTPGNTAGNLYNGGRFCEYEDLIYFSNINDSGALYTMKNNMTDYKKIASDNARFINVDENHIYYSRLNESSSSAGALLASFNSTGLYRCDHKGKKTTSLYDDFTGLVSQYGNDIFYQHYESSTGTTLYKVRIDGEGEMKISSNAILPGSYSDEYMYYSDMDNTHYVYKYNVSDSTCELFLEKRSMYPLINGDYMYYISIDDDYTLFRVPLNGGESEQVIDERISTYNISTGGKYLYYQIDASDNNKLCKMDIQSGDTTVIKEGNFTNINVTSNYVFFYDYGGATCYYLENGTNIPEKFNPETD